MLKFTRRGVAAIAAVLALGTGTAVAATAAATAAPAAAAAAIPPVCTTGNLAVWVNYDAQNGAAGTWYYPLEFTNLTNHTCRSWGWPGVSATTAAGQRLGDAAARDALYRGAWVNIPPGGTAHAVLAYGAAEVSTSGCKPRAAALLKVYPPNQFGARHAFFDFPVCTLAHHVYLRVTALRPGAGS